MAPQGSRTAPGPIVYLIVIDGGETPVLREAQLAVLFADVSGSTQLYDTLGLSLIHI